MKKTTRVMIVLSFVYVFFNHTPARACHRTPENQPTCMDMQVESNGNINITYIDFLPNDVYFIRSIDGGNSWSLPVNSFDSNKEASRPRVAISKKGKIYTIWVEPGRKNKRVLVNSSDDGGATWSVPVQIGLSNGGIGIATYKKNKVYAVFKGRDPKDIFFKASTDQGVTWRRKINLSHAVGSDSHPIITVDWNTGETYVIWEGTSPDDITLQAVFFTRSGDNGRTWTSPQRICNSQGLFVRPQIDVDMNGNINIVWTDNREPRETFYCRSTDSGTTWSSAVNVSQTSGDSLRGHIASDPSGTVYITWEDVTDVPKEDIFLSRSQDGGVTWTPGINISNSDIRSYRAPIGTDDAGNIYIIWEEIKKDKASGQKMSNLFFSRSLDAGVSWSSPTSLFNWRQP